MIRTSSSPVLVPEDQFFVGRVAYSGRAGESRFSARRTRVAEPDPDVALTYGGAAGFMARLYLRSTPAGEVHQTRSVLPLPPRGAMETSFRNVSDPCAWPMAHAIDIITFDLPHLAVAKWAEDYSTPMRLLRTLPSGSSASDAVMRAFGNAIIPALEAPAAKEQFFVDHILDGVCAYLFKSPAFGQGLQRGGLAPWQELRAKELMESRISTDLTLEEIARECGLSVAHFARAFRESCGITPHKWLVSRRVERARSLLRHTDLPLSTVAAECGFADQAHLTNVFSRAVGTPPGAFRRYWNVKTRPAPADAEELLH